MSSSTRNGYAAKFLHIFVNFVPILFFAVAVYLFHQELSSISFEALRGELRAWPSYRIEWCLVMVALNFIALSGYDWFGLIRQGERLPYGRVFKVSFMSFSLSNLVGHSLVSGTSLRLKFYGKANIALSKITRLSIENSVSAWLGFIFLGGLAFVIYPEEIAALGIHTAVPQLIGFVMLGVIAANFVAAAFVRGTLRIKTFSLSYPPPRVVLGLLVLSSVDLAICASALYALVPFSVSIGFFHFLSIFIIALLVGLISQVPGGLGVFDGLFLKLISPYAETQHALTALIIFRLLYYALPFAISAGWIGFDYLRETRQRTRQAMSILRFIARPIVAQALAILTFASGMVLIVSGNVPAVQERIITLNDMVPLALVEFSHVAASLAGLMLLVLSFQLWAKNRKALHITQLVLCVGIIASMLKGFDYEEALALFALLVTSWLFRSAFYKKRGPGFRKLSLLQIIAIFICLSVSVWLGFFAYKAVPYSDDLWFTFDVNNDSARFLRALLVLLLSFALILVRSYLRGHRTLPQLKPLSPEDAAAVTEILKTTVDTEAQLVWLGDKHVLLSDDKKAFLMFGIQGNSWIVLGNVYGARESGQQLIQSFARQADLQDAKPVFYQLSENSLALALEAGFQVFKLGEEAHIELQKFSLEGTARRSLRASMNRGEREGMKFVIKTPAEVTSMLPQLRNISDDWLREKNAQEKGFSLGFFTEDYIQRFPCAVIEKDGETLAFANLLLGSGRELSIDLMRHRAGIPKGVMDYLFLNILMWGKAEKFETFNFGMSPLSGLRSTPWGPVWYKIGSFIFKHGEYFYNFQGLRDYKEKYDPIWKMRFIAAPGGLSFLKTISDVALLIGGGAMGILGIRKNKK